ncbi:MAG TPA: aldo/keto reductase, partial [Rhodoglobus sp.]|nr:aldo/keto reductase [Rhodoglobus sp.]
EFAEFADSQGLTPPVAALAWVSQLPGVTTVIPGARNVRQAVSNASAGSVPQLTPEFTEQITELYDRTFREAIHPRW